MSGIAYDPSDEEPLEGLFRTVFDLADQITSRIGPDEIEVRLRRTLRDAATGSKPRAPKSDQSADPGRVDPDVPDWSRPMQTLQPAGLPSHRIIVALDIERSANRSNPIKGELRNKIYELFETALRASGIDRRHRDQFIDRGDGVLALIHPVDQAPKPLMLNRVVPLLNQFLGDYNASVRRHSQPQRELRIRAVIHAGEVHYDTNGCFGEALDVAFRLLDSGPVKRALRERAEPLIVVVSGEIYHSVVRHGYGGIDQEAFLPLVRVQVAGRRYPGWIHLPEHGRQYSVTQLADYQRFAV